MNRRISTLILAVGLVTLELSPASAHTVLIASSPVANSTITLFPKKITLIFGDPLLVLGKRVINTIQVVNSKGKVMTGTSNRVSGAVLSNVLLTIGAISGKYRVNFRVVAQDGHVVSGGFNFYVKSKLRR